MPSCLRELRTDMMSQENSVNTTICELQETSHQIVPEEKNSEEIVLSFETDSTTIPLQVDDTPVENIVQIEEPVVEIKKGFPGRKKKV